VMGSASRTCNSAWTRRPRSRIAGISITHTPTLALRRILKKLDFVRPSPTTGTALEHASST
jgi:hypothetical protein